MYVNNISYMYYLTIIYIYIYYTCNLLQSYIGFLVTLLNSFRAMYPHPIFPPLPCHPIPHSNLILPVPSPLLRPFLTAFYFFSLERPTPMIPNFSFSIGVLN